MLTPAERISYNTWHLMKGARRLDVRLGEETLTDLLMLNLKAHERPYGIRVYQTPKHIEANQGTDLEVVVRSGRVADAWKYAIQAKKLYPNGYRGVRRKVGSSQRFQIDVLEDYARTTQAVPCYLLYNYVASLLCSTVPNHISYWQCGLSCSEAQFGCTLVPSRIVSNAIYRRR